MNSTSYGFAENQDVRVPSNPPVPKHGRSVSMLPHYRKDLHPLTDSQQLAGDCVQIHAQNVQISKTSTTEDGSQNSGSVNKLARRSRLKGRMSFRKLCSLTPNTAYDFADSTAHVATTRVQKFDQQSPAATNDSNYYSPIVSRHNRSLVIADKSVSSINSHSEHLSMKSGYGRNLLCLTPNASYASVPRAAHSSTHSQSAMQYPPNPQPNYFSFQGWCQVCAQHQCQPCSTPNENPIHSHSSSANTSAEFEFQYLNMPTFCTTLELTRFQQTTVSLSSIFSQITQCHENAENQEPINLEQGNYSPSLKPTKVSSLPAAALASSDESFGELPTHFQPDVSRPPPPHQVLRTLTGNDLITASSMETPSKTNMFNSCKCLLYVPDF
ncbi:hypothetical protein Aperf_G00000054727 [Anoplocephala perfoliata]